ncbi:MAG: hypothetical protein U0K71_15150, partial [Paludibacteraceae bacterium]|nr:hypothetical protein [Paludibacteraceae bacterium]
MQSKHKKTSLPVSKNKLKDRRFEEKPEYQPISSNLNPIISLDLTSEQIKTCTKMKKYSILYIILCLFMCGCSNKQQEFTT